MQSLLTVLDCGIWLVGDCDAALEEAFDGDPRVRSGRPDKWVSDRSRARMIVDVPMIADALFARRIQEMLVEDIGRLIVIADERAVATITTTRAYSRSARWVESLDADSYSALGQLFDVSTMPAAEVGLTMVRQEPSLAAEFGGWG
jgi:hypothetical protein